MIIRGDGGNTCLVSADDCLGEPGLARGCRMQEEIAICRGRERLLQAPEGPRAFLWVPAGTFQRRGLAASSFRFARATPLERGPPQLERVISSLVLSPWPVPPVQGRSSSSCLSYFRCFHVVVVPPSWDRTLDRPVGFPSSRQSADFSTSALRRALRRQNNEERAIEMAIEIDRRIVVRTRVR